MGAMSQAFGGWDPGSMAVVALVAFAICVAGGPGWRGPRAVSRRFVGEEAVATIGGVGILVVVGRVLWG